MADVMSVSNASRALGLSERRVRALIHSGQLSASRLGIPWAVERRAVDRFLQKERGRGRPLNQSNSWALLAILAGEWPSELRSDAISRLRRYARDPDWLIALLRHSEPRVHEMSLWIPSEDMSKLAGYPLVHSGLSADSAIPQLDVIPRRDEPLDVYASAEIADEIERRLLPEHSRSDPNLILRIPRSNWVLHQGPEAPFAVVAADLLDHRDARVRRAGEDALRRIAIGRSASN